MADNKDGFETERWRCMGLRVPAGEKKLWMLYEDPYGEVKWFAKNKQNQGHLIGAYYEVEVKRHDDGVTARLASAKMVERALDETAQQWIAEDRAATTQAQMEAARKSMKAAELNALGEMTLGQAAEFIANGPWTTRAARVAVVLKKLGI